MERTLINPSASDGKSATKMGAREFPRVLTSTVSKTTLTYDKILSQFDFTFNRFPHDLQLGFYQNHAKA